MRLNMLNNDKKKQQHCWFSYALGTLCLHGSVLLVPLGERIPANQYKVILTDHLYPIMKLFFYPDGISLSPNVQSGRFWADVSDISALHTIMKTPTAWISFGRIVFMPSVHFQTHWKCSGALLWPDTLIILFYLSYLFFTCHPALYVRQKLDRRNMRQW